MEEGNQQKDTGIVTALGELPRETLLDEGAMARAFGVSTRTVRRMVARYELPPPIRTAGRSVWMVGRVVAWFEAQAEQAERDAKKATERIRKDIP